MGQAQHDLLLRELNDPEFRLKTFFKGGAAVLKQTAVLLRVSGPDAVLPPAFAQHADQVLYSKPEGAEKIAYILSDFSRELTVLDRYERRSQSVR